MKRSRHLIAGDIRAALKGAEPDLMDARFFHRLHAVLLVSQSCSCQQVAAWFGDHPRSVERWSLACERGGVEGLRNHHAGGRPGRLLPSEQSQLLSDLGRAPACQGYSQARWSGKLVALHVEHRFGVQLSQRRCQCLLKQQKEPSSAASLAQSLPKEDKAGVHGPA